MKVYTKKGNTNYREKKMVAKLTEVFQKKIKEDPSFESKIHPATSFEELKAMHDRYAIEDAEIVSTSNEDSNTGQAGSVSNNTQPKDDGIDPMNREAPNVRDYVLEDDFSSKEQKEADAQPKKTHFDEPESFEEAFQMPGEEDEKPSGGGFGNKSESEKSSKPRQHRESKSHNAEPINPDYENMTSAKKKKQSKKFAKYIVEGVCALAEQGFVWYANKDINAGKLAEYEVTGELDLTLGVTLEGGQEATVKQFFEQQCFRAEQLSKIDPEQKADLADALAEVLDEKGVGPTPMQNLAVIGLSILGQSAMNLIALKSQTNSLLNQLRGQPQEYVQEPEPVRQAVQPQPQPPSQQAEQTEPTVQDTMPDAEPEFENPIIDKPLTTLE